MRLTHSAINAKSRPPLLVLLAVPMLLSLATAGDAATITGQVIDRSGQPVAGAAIVVEGSTIGASDSEGNFSVQLSEGPQVIHLSHPAFRTLRHELVVDGDLGELQLVLAPPMSVSESITVTAIRAGDDAPVTTRDLDYEEIDELSYGQDVPALLQYTPSMTWYSDSGTGSNYSYFSLRGIQQTRINMTLDGAPLNDPAEHALYFNNFHDFTSAVDSIQVQRGVGT
jgi:iron complex outermembrane receptor protein